MRPRDQAKIEFPAKCLSRCLVPSWRAPVAIGCLLLWGAAVRGEDLGARLLPASCRIDCVGQWCCDDYDRKPLPGFCHGLRFCCDDYCRKCLPGTYAALSFCCDDYRPKCLPPVCFPPLRAWLSCGPTAGCGTRQALGQPPPAPAPEK